MTAGTAYGRAEAAGCTAGMENRMKKIEFDILYAFYERGYMPADELCSYLFKGQPEVVSACGRLEKGGLINSSGIASEGIDCLQEYKIDNAVILAAGLSSRFVPLSYEIPKGLLTVKGEVLVERQIRQLHEKGISEIAVVVGCMKEKFEYLKEKYGVELIGTDEFKTRNNHSSIFAAKGILKNSIITSSDLYFAENIFQSYAYDSYYCTVYHSGKTAERGIETDEDDKILKTFYGDKCCDVWVTLGYAFFSAEFSRRMVSILSEIYENPETVDKYWADIQDEHLGQLYMYAKRVKNNVIFEFDTLEELRMFDAAYQYNSNSRYMKQVCALLAAEEKDIINLESLRKVKPSMFKFQCGDDIYICDTSPGNEEKLTYMGFTYYQYRDDRSDYIKLYRMDKNIGYLDDSFTDTEEELNQIYDLTQDFVGYHRNALPLCAAENIISEFANLPYHFGFQERYIMNNTYSFNMNDNFIGCEKLLPFYQKLSDVCRRMFHAEYSDARPFSGMHCIDMVLKTITKPGEKLMILGAEYGGHASVRPVAERLGLNVSEAPYSMEKNDFDYNALNRQLKAEGIKYVLIAPSDLIVVPDIKKIDTGQAVVLYDCSQVMGLIAAGLAENPLTQMENIIMFGGTHKTFPGPASGLILTNSQELHNKMETQINPKYLRHSQMHQKISLLFALVEFEKFGRDYMRQVLHSANYLGKRLQKLSFRVKEIQGRVSATHEIFIECSKEEMETIYDNAYKCQVTLNKKHKKLFSGYGIRLGTQEIARYDWNDAALDQVAVILGKLREKDLDVMAVRKIIAALPEKTIHYTFDADEYSRFFDIKSVK